MSTVRIDIAEGAGTELAAAGWTATRIAVVEGLTGAKEERLFAAVDALKAPPYSMRIGQRHPTRGDIYIISFAPEPYQGAVRVRIQYGTLPGGGKTARAPTVNGFTVESASVLQMEPCDTDANGKPMVVERTAGGVTRRQAIHAEVGVAHRVIRLTRFSGTNEEKKFKGWVGGINGGDWNGGATRTWRLNTIASRWNGERAQWENTYEIEYSKRGFDYRGVWIDPETGRQPSEGAVEKKFQVTHLIPFGSLGLPTNV